MFSSLTTIPTNPPPLIANTVVTALNKEREREKRQLSMIVHNLSESTAPEGETRKRDDIKHVTDIFKYLGAKTKIIKAARLGKKFDKPRLLKITVDTVESKALILSNCTNLQKTEPSSHFNKIYITPDLTPTERETNCQLRTQLKEINKDGNCYKIKKREDSAEEGLDPPLVLINNVNSTLLKLLVINFQSVLAKRADLTNLIHEKQPDIIFRSETWLSPNINSTEFFPTGYSLF